MSIKEKVLNNPFVYNLVQLGLGMDFYSVAAKKIKTAKAKSILEIGCGTGELLKFMSPKNYLGLDINGEYLRKAETAFGCKNIKFQEADATNLPKINGKFDLVLLVNFIHHLNDKELEKVLKGVKKNVNYKKFILIDGKPNAGPFTKLLEDGDLGNNFRSLQEIEKFVSKHFLVKESFYLKRIYWPYIYPFLILE